MEQADLQELRRTVAESTHWTTVALEVNTELVRMGSFSEPLCADLAGLSHGQWQMEQCKRTVLAVLDYILEGPYGIRGHIE